ncbi:hypothetical protein [Geofilum rubicundum]|nr:hypothetical protein [Geofilum rubicundum]
MNLTPILPRPKATSPRHMYVLKISVLLLGLSFFSCTPIRYLSEPVYQSLDIGLDHEGFSPACAGCPQNFIFDYDVNMTSTWEYFDFTTGKTFEYTVKNNKSGKGIQVQSTDDINTALSQIKEQLLVENGQISISKLLEN